jgi:hypothetical protein
VLAWTGETGAVFGDQEGDVDGADVDPDARVGGLGVRDSIAGRFRHDGQEVLGRSLRNVVGREPPQMDVGLEARVGVQGTALRMILWSRGSRSSSGKRREHVVPGSSRMEASRSSVITVIRSGEASSLMTLRRFCSPARQRNSAG